MTRILLLIPSTKPRGTLFSSWQYDAIPSQCPSTIRANFSYGLSRCHLRADFHRSTNRLAHTSRLSPHSWLNIALRRYALFNLRLALNSAFNDGRPSCVRLARRDSDVYFWPLMNRRSFPESRAYSLFRTLSKASFKCLRMWNLSWRMPARGASPAFRVELRNGFHMPITARRIPLHFRGPSHAKKRSMLFSERSVPPNRTGRPRIRSLTTIR